MPAEREFTGELRAATGGRAFVALPFDPSGVWGAKDRHHITGTINGVKVRGPLATSDEGAILVLGAAWLRDAPVRAGDTVSVVLMPEGPQQESLAPDIVAALEKEPGARAFFDSLATFYRKAYLRWIEATTRRPDVRAARIDEMVELLKAGKKQR